MKATLIQPDYRELLDNVTGVIYTTDIKGQIEFASAGVAALTGHSSEELVGRHFSFLVAPDCLDKVYEHYNHQVKAAIRETVLEFYCQTREGEIKWVEQTALFIQRKDHTWGFQCFVRDVSEKKDFQRQLIIAKTEADEARKMQEQFLANMSHEIRTPMNGIVGMTNLLLETPLSTQQQQFAGVIRHSADNLLVIVNDILDLSKIKAGKLAIEKIAFQLQDVTANIWALFEPRIFKKGLQFVMELDPAIPSSLLGDPHRLNQVLINLVGNAVKFTEKGSVKLAVTLQKQDQKTVSLVFSIEDTGIGISREQLPYIFESFSQAASDITRKYGGTGLGLTICSQLLDLQGAKISVDSESGKGTRFSFQISYDREFAQIASNPKAQNIKDGQAVFQGRHFLVVEDNPINQQLIEYVIKKAGAEVTVADDGREAIDHLENQSFDLIIMDLQMPVMDGYETTRYLRENLKLRTPILAMTANALKGEQVRCLEAGMNGYMSKPFDFREFYNRAAELIEAASQQPAETHEICHHNNCGLFDLSLLEEVGDRDYVRDTVSTLLEALPQYIADIQQAFINKNFECLAFLAHKLKGTMGVFQARTITDQLDKIEQMAREKRDPGGLVPITINLFRQLDRDLRKHECHQVVKF